MTVNLQVGDRIRLSDLGASRSPKTKIRIGIVTALPGPTSRNAGIGVRCDGNKNSTIIHRSYIELDDAQ
jgi:hypothetical protein